MHRSIRRLPALLGLGACLVGGTGCDLQWVKVTIPDFESKQVTGIWVWRQSEQSGQYVRDTEIEFGERIPAGGGVELLRVETTTGPLGERSSLPTGIERDAANPDRVTLSLGFTRLSAPGIFKVSTYNAAGDSPLSTASAQL